jgi:hypothetical protein
MWREIPHFVRNDRLTIWFIEEEVAIRIVKFGFYSIFACESPLLPYSTKKYHVIPNESRLRDE